MNFAEALKILLKTIPYLVLRLVVYLLVGVGIGIYLACVVLLAKIFGGIGGLIFLIGLGVMWGLLRLVKNYLLYLVKAGHVAVVTELIHKGKLPEGVNQVKYGRKIISGMFKSVSALFVVDQLVNGILRAVNRSVVRIAEMLPIPGMEGLAKIVTIILNFAVTYVDESILSYNVARPEENAFESAKNGLILYAQNWKPILKTAVGLAFVNMFAFVVLFVALLFPFAPLALMATSGGWKFFWFAMAFVLAYCLKLALVNPFSLVAMIITYNKSVEGQVPSPEWESRLDTISAKFRDLKVKARQATATPSPS